MNNTIIGTGYGGSCFPKDVLEAGEAVRERSNYIIGRGNHA